MLLQQATELFYFIFWEGLIGLLLGFFIAFPPPLISNIAATSLLHTLISFIPVQLISLYSLPSLDYFICYQRTITPSSVSICSILLFHRSSYNKSIWRSFLVYLEGLQVSNEIIRNKHSKDTLWIKREKKSLSR